MMILVVFSFLEVWIAGKMTSVLQLTDTDLSFPLKAAASRHKDLLKQKMRNQAHREGKVCCNRSC